MLSKKIFAFTLFVAFVPFIKADPVSIELSSPLMMFKGENTKTPSTEEQQHEAVEEKRFHDRESSDVSEELRGNLNDHGIEGKLQGSAEQTLPHPKNQTVTYAYNFVRLLRRSALSACAIYGAAYLIPKAAIPRIVHYTLSPTCSLLPEQGSAAQWLGCGAFPNAAFHKKASDLQELENQSRIDPQLLFGDMIFGRQKNLCSKSETDLQTIYKLQEQWQQLADESKTKISELYSRKNAYPQAAWEWEFNRAADQKYLLQCHERFYKSRSLLCLAKEDDLNGKNALYPENIKFFEEAIRKSETAQSLLTRAIDDYRNHDYNNNFLSFFSEEREKVTFSILQLHCEIIDTLSTEASSTIQMSQRTNLDLHQEALELFDKATTKIVEVIQLGNDYTSSYPDSSFLRFHWPVLKEQLQATQKNIATRNLNGTSLSLEHKHSQNDGSSDFTF